MSVSIPRLNRLLQRAELRPLIKTPLPRGSKLYLVGGIVRDFFLRRKSVDIDIAVDGDFALIIDRLRKKIKGRYTNHPAFQTASIELENYRFDFARTRQETYPRPAVLPKVEPSSIKDDLMRRDFSINAMAITMKPRPGQFIDPCQGHQDLKLRKIKILHDDSFRDDPTRIFRAYRYARRFSFAIDRKTRDLIRRDLHYVRSLSSERIINELNLIAKERCWLEITRDLKGCGLLLLIFDRPILRRAKLATDRFLFLLAHLRSKILEDAPIRISMLKSAKEIKRIEKIVARLKKAQMRSRSYKLLARLEPSTIKMLRNLYPELRMKIRKYTKDQGLEPLITGTDLITMGLKPSPSFRKFLNRIRSLQIDQKIKEKETAIELIRRWISS